MILKKKKYYESNREKADRILKSKFNLLRRIIQRLTTFLSDAGFLGRYTIYLATLLIIFQAFKWWGLHHTRVLNGGNNLVNLSILLLANIIVMFIWIRWKEKEPQGFGRM